MRIPLSRQCTALQCLSRRPLAALFALWALVACVALASAAQASEPELRVGSKRFTESYVLAQIVAQTAQAAGAQTRVLQGLGNTAIVYEALRSGQIDVYAEYTGTIALEIVKDSAHDSLPALQQALAPLGLGVGVPLGFNDGYALAMRRRVRAVLASAARVSGAGWRGVFGGRALHAWLEQAIA